MWSFFFPKIEALDIPASEKQRYLQGLMSSVADVDVNI